MKLANIYLCEYVVNIAANGEMCKYTFICIVRRVIAVQHAANK